MVSELRVWIWIATGGNSNSIFIAPNLYLKTDSRRTKQNQKTIIINLRHSKGQRHREKSGKAKVRVDTLVQRDRFSEGVERSG